MMLGRLAVYYHMPCHIGENREVYANPVMGTFVESLAEHFRSVVLLSPEVDAPDPAASHKLIDERVNFVSLGPVGHYWDHLQRMTRIRRAVEQSRDTWEILLLRAPSPRAYAIWKYAGRPKRTALLLVGNAFPRWHSGHSSLYGPLLVARAAWFARGLRRICAESQHVIMANSPSLVRYWQEKSARPIGLVHTSSLGSGDILGGEGRTRFGENSYRLLFVGRVCLDKGIKELLRALSILNKDRDQVVFLDIVGPAADLGGATLPGLVRESGVEGVVKCHGSVPFGPKLFEFYRRADAYVLPSYHEGMPKTVWEAMSQGTPVIASEVGGMKDLFQDGRDVLFLEPKSSESIVKAVQRLRENGELSQRLSRQGIIRVRSVTREAQAERIAGLMQGTWGS